jgi:hypothetical protein
MSDTLRYVNVYLRCPRRPWSRNDTKAVVGYVYLTKATAIKAKELAKDAITLRIRVNGDNINTVVVEACDD